MLAKDWEDSTWLGFKSELRPSPELNEVDSSPLVLVPDYIICWSTKIEVGKYEVISINPKRVQPTY